jgi:hypothetical protein
MIFRRGGRSGRVSLKSERVGFRERVIRCPLLRIDPAQRPRLAAIRDNLTARIAEAEQQGWLGEAEGLKVSLAAADTKLTQVDLLIARRDTAVSLGMPAFRDISAQTATGRA